MKLVNRYLSWVTVRYDGIDGGFRLLGESLGGNARPGGQVDFSVHGFEMDLEVELTLELKGFLFWGGGGGGGRR